MLGTRRLDASHTSPISTLAETPLLFDRKGEDKQLVDEVLKQKSDHEGAKKLSEQLK